MITPDALACPRCQTRFEVSEEDPDATLSGLWHHLSRHSTGPENRRQLFIQAQQNAAGNGT